MLDAILLGAVAQSSLILSGLVVYGVKVPPTVIGPSPGLGPECSSAPSRST